MVDSVPFASRTEMFFEKHRNTEDYKIWLSQDEITLLLNAAENTQHRMALALGVRCGLRSDEVVRVCPRDVKESQAGQMLRVDSAKSDGLRQTPIPETLANSIEIANEYRDAGVDEPVLDVSTRTLRRWIKKTAEPLVEETNEEMWSYLTMHDLRRTWATSLKGEDVDAMIVCDWGGWSDLETFLEHYRGKFSPEQQRRQREKVEWL